MHTRSRGPHGFARSTYAAVFVVMAALFDCSEPAVAQHRLAQPDFVSPMSRVWKGDLDGMLKRRFVRILVPYNKTLYIIDRGRQLGLVAELGQALEAWLNAKHAKGHLKTHVVFLPAARDALVTALLESKDDVIAGGLTITPERQALVDFATPWIKDLKEIVVTSPSSPQSPAFVGLAFDVGFRCFPLVVEGVELLLQTMVSRDASVDRAAEARLSVLGLHGAAGLPAISHC